MRLCRIGIHNRDVCLCKHCDKPKHKLIEVNGKLLVSTVLREKTRNGKTTSVIKEESEVYYRCRRCDHHETRVEVVIKKIAKMGDNDVKKT